MGCTQGLSSDLDRQASIAVCPDCGTDHGDLQPVTIGLLDGVALRRCLHCGNRRSAGIPAQRVLNCSACDLPFLEQPDHHADRCAPCSSGGFEIDDEDGALSAATEAEVRTALADSWRFVGSSRVSEYLDRVAREIARGMDRAPLDCEVLLLAESSFRTLALPSGTLLISEGALQALEDEAELAFVLGHELAHAAGAHAARPLVALGLRALAAEGRGGTGQPWARAALDLLRLGHGDRRELEADARSVKALVAAGYDADAPRRYLERLARRSRSGQPGLAELVLAHPPPAARLRHIERTGVSRNGGEDRVNREVFRRAVGHTVLASELETVRAFDAGDRAVGTGLGWKVAWIVIGGAALLFALYRLGLL